MMSQALQFVRELKASSEAYHHDDDRPAFDRRQRRLWDAIEKAGAADAVLALLRAGCDPNRLARRRIRRSNPMPTIPGYKPRQGTRPKNPRRNMDWLALEAEIAGVLRCAQQHNDGGIPHSDALDLIALSVGWHTGRGYPRPVSNERLIALWQTYDADPVCGPILKREL